MTKNHIPLHTSDNQQVHHQILLLQLNGQDISYGARMHAWKNKLILVLGLLKVAGTQ